VEHRKVKELPESEQPLEKALSHGMQALSDGELLSIILRTGTRNRNVLDLSADLLCASSRCPGLVGLNYLELQDLVAIDGIGRVKALEIMAVVELGKRLARSNRPERTAFTGPEDVADYCMQNLRHLDTEQLLAIYTDTRGRLIGEKVLSMGTVNSSLISPREVFLNALRQGAVSMFLVHNHPSGDPKPSSEDIAVTKRIADGGRLIGIRLEDHVIIGDNRYMSMKALGYL